MDVLRNYDKLLELYRGMKARSAEYMSSPSVGRLEPFDVFFAGFVAGTRNKVALARELFERIEAIRLDIERLE